MRDIHCHILPGVDDGSHDLKESLAMLSCAYRVGITSIVCTPHCRDPWFDYDAMRRAFRRLQAHTDLPLQMAFEVNHTKLMDIGIGWASRLANQETGEFLLELSTRASEADFGVYARTVYALQAAGLKVTIAHPERYSAIQKNVELAHELVRMGCKLQASATFVESGRFSPVRRCAVKLAREGLYSCVASDAHCPEHYACVPKAQKILGLADA